MSRFARWQRRSDDRHLAGASVTRNVRFGMLA
jgi:hypothetical protein